MKSNQKKQNFILTLINIMVVDSFELRTREPILLMNVKPKAVVQKYRFKGIRACGRPVFNLKYISGVMNASIHERLLDV